MKVVTVGTSLICEKLIAAFKEVGIEVFACVGRDEKRTSDFASKTGVEYHANDYDAVIKSDIFDTVYIALPNSLHYEYAKKALLNGKNVIVEKPFTANLKQAKELVMLASEKNLFVFDAITTLHELAYKQLKEDLKLLGPIKNVSVSFYKVSSKIDKFNNNEECSAFSNKMCGGALMDLGVYNIAFIIGLFGMPKAVKYHTNMEKGIDISGVSILKYNDFIVTSLAGKNANTQNGFIISGEKGYVKCDSPNSCFDSYTIYFNDGTTKERKYEKDSCYAQELIDFKSIVDYKNIKKANEYITLSLMYLKTMDELRKSAGIEFEADKN